MKENQPSTTHSNTKIVYVGNYLGQKIGFSSIAVAMIGVVIEIYLNWGMTGKILIILGVIMFIVGGVIATIDMVRNTRKRKRNPGENDWFGF